MRLTLITAAALGLALSAGAVANPDEDKAERHERHMDRMAERLDLSDAQRDEIDALVRAHMERTQAAREQLKQAHEQLRDEMRAVLTPEQAEKLDAMHDDMGERMGEHRGRKKGHDDDHDRHEH